MTSIWYLFF